MKPTTVNKWLNINRILPAPLCLLCGQTHSRSSLICDGCKADLPWLDGQCAQCAQPLPGDNHQRRCGRCLKKPPRFQLTRAPFLYDPPIDRLVNDLKNHARLEVIDLMAKLFVDHFRLQIEQRPPELIIPVPLHTKRLYSRGYNQAAELAERIARLINLPFCKDSCRRLIDTPHQQGLSAENRQKNLHRCFEVKPTIEASRIAIVDDVMTTGATANALATKLRQQGAEHIEIWCLARTPSRR